MRITYNHRLGFGDKLGTVGMLVWLMIGVGPWWLGVLFFIGITAFNTFGPKER